MPCKSCKSENVQNLDGELTVSLPDPKGLTVPPLYVCQNVLVCLDCGFSESHRLPRVNCSRSRRPKPRWAPNPSPGAFHNGHTAACTGSQQGCVLKIDSLRIEALFLREPQ